MLPKHTKNVKPLSAENNKTIYILAAIIIVFLLLLPSRNAGATVAAQSTPICVIDEATGETICFSGIGVVTPTATIATTVVPPVTPTAPHHINLPIARTP